MTCPRRFLAFLLVLALPALAACRSTAPAAPPQAPSAPPATAAPAAPPLSLAIRWTRDSAERKAVFLQVYRSATAHVEREAARRPGGGWAVSLDADETVIDNSVYQVERERAGLPFDGPSWHAWTKRREATPLPGAQAFLARVRELGGRIAIVTNRTVSECPDTEAVFRAHELAFDVILCKPDAGPSDKNPRFEAVAKGTTHAGLPPLEIVAFVGDNIQDFPALSQAIRQQGDDAFAAFGTLFFALPNPMYGSWERN
ncbi:MAG TPA: HAD family acid phosphatase [Vicinamibacteria bacterium]|nr:HAD family acid phosphatase [Vicinamibacteria bacterium]